jgi:hypothetical protein
MLIETLLTTITLIEMNHFMAYAATHIIYTASPMILTIHSNASYFLKVIAQSCLGRIFFLFGQNNDSSPLPFYGVILITSVILKYVMSSAPKAQLAALFLKAQDACILHTPLDFFWQIQPPSGILTDNLCVIGIVNDTVKQRCSKAIYMHFYLVPYRVQQLPFMVHWKPTRLTTSPIINLQLITKHCATRICKAMHPSYDW